jgi:hypothetical protein
LDPTVEIIDIAAASNPELLAAELERLAAILAEAGEKRSAP